MEFEIIRPSKSFLHPQVFLKKIDYVINLTAQVNADIPFRYLALQPAHDKLLPLYRSHGFVPLDKTGWLFFKVNQ